MDSDIHVLASKNKIYKKDSIATFPPTSTSGVIDNTAVVSNIIIHMLYNSCIVESGKL